MPNIVIRVDSSNIIGTGHVYRCLNLMEYYPGYNIEFICKNSNYNLISKISQKYPVHTIKLNDQSKINMNINTWLGEPWIDDCRKTIEHIKNKDIDWLIIDHYAIDIKWENMIKPYVKNIMVIDDFTNRPHNCQILLNQQINFLEGSQLYYLNTVNKDCKLLLGKDYIILNSTYLKFTKITDKNDKLTRINIFMGGSDPTNETSKIIDICHKLNQDFRHKIIYDVIVGTSNKNNKEIERKCNLLENFNYYYDLSNMLEILIKANLCIGSAGGTMYERCALKIPTLIIIIADNQLTTIQKFIDANAGILIGHIKDGAYDKHLSNKLRYLQENYQQIVDMKKGCTQICDINNLSKLSQILIS